MSYVATTSGLPCWYELGTTDMDGATAFYSAALGWQVASAGMPDFDYRLASDAEGFSVAGLMAADEGMPSAWYFYLEVADSDAFVAQVSAAGGAVLMPPADIPGTGRYAICADPQGAVFGVLQPRPMDGDAPAVGAFDQERHGHGAWHELMTTDPEAAWDFYAPLLGWTKGEVYPMGNAGVYQLFAAQGTDLGAVQPLGDAPVPSWLVYFTVAGVQDAASRITAAGGTVVHGPSEVPGGASILLATDPQGAVFAVTGPLN